MDSSFLAYVDTILHDLPTHINSSISLEECFCLTVLIFIVILEHSESLSRLGNNFIHSAFDFLATPTRCVWCAARLNWRYDLAVGSELSALHLIAYSIYNFGFEILGFISHIIETFYISFPKSYLYKLQ